MLQKLIEHNDRNDINPVCCFAIISPNLYKEKAVGKKYMFYKLTMKQREKQIVGEFTLANVKHGTAV